jgi:hypothetical protein
VAYYEICLIGGDGAPVCCERHPLDLDTVWGRVFTMAELESERGMKIHVLDDQGGSSLALAQPRLRFRLNNFVRSRAVPIAHSANGRCTS